MKIKNLILLASLLACPIVSAQTVTYSNLGPGDSFSTTNGWSIGYPFSELEGGQKVAFSFEALTTGSIHSADLALSRLSIGGSNDVTVGIFSDSGGAPGALIDSSSLIVSDTPEIATFSFTSGSVITSGVTYWIGVHPSSATPTDVVWWWNYLEGGQTSDRSGINTPSEVLLGGLWGGVSSGIIESAYSINVSPVPEPSTYAALVSLFILGFCIISKRRNPLK